MSASKKRKADDSDHRIECLDCPSHESKKAKTSRNTFIKFLKADKPHSEHTWESVTKDHFTFENMRRFSGYLFNNTSVVESTAQDYLSSMRSQAAAIFNYEVEIHSAGGADKRWKQLKEDVRKKYTSREFEQRTASGKMTEISNKGAPCMSLMDFNEIMVSLFKQLSMDKADVTKLVFDRNLLAHTWVLAGRPYELGTVSYNGYRVNPTDNILRATILRTKQKRIQVLSVPCAPLGYPHVSYAVDPIHALGTFMVLGAHEGVLPDECVFPLTSAFVQPLSSVGDAVAEGDDDEEDEDEETEGFAESSEAKKKKDDPFAGYITKVLAANVPSSQIKYTSYSTRRGVLQQMGDASDNLRHADAAVRGGHVGTMKAMDTFFEYWATTNEHDNKAGEILKKNSTHNTPIISILSSSLIFHTW
jgi:hypothetical protein